MDIKLIGYNEKFNKLFEKQCKKGTFPARVSSQGRNFYSIICEKGFLNAKLSGSVRYNANLKSDMPAVGDWVEISLRGDKAYILSILPRKSFFSRRSAGKVVDEQVISANVDTIFIVMSLDENFNINRTQRYVSSAIAGKITPVIILSKSDVCDNPDYYENLIKESFPCIAVETVSSKNPNTPHVLNKFLKKGETAMFAGSSGVGKSTLINILLGEEKQKTSIISLSVKKGRHTTSSRDLIVLENGAIVIDNPGIRELQMWNVEEFEGFEQIKELSLLCKFYDCKHDTEPDCAVKKAVEKGTISQNILDMWRIQSIEMHELKKKKNESEKIIQNKKLKKKKIISDS